MKNRIVVFANQKGGVGKSTLCLLLANYLNWKRKNVCIIDTDLQQTIAGIRNDDKEFYGDTEPYAIQGFDISTPEVMQQLMNNSKQLDGYVLMDAPGNMNQDGLIPMFTHADYIICPFRYDKVSLSSTGDFVRALQMIRVADMFNMIGTVLPPIPSRAALERINSYDITPSQRELVKDAFEGLISITNGKEK